MKLFQFQPISKYTLQNLILKKVWASNPRSFNDPFEFTVQENYRVINEGKIEMLSQEEIDRLEKIKAEIFKMAVTCFSEDGDNLLLWAHYASNHAGMCLTFEIDEPPRNLWKVEYSEMFPDLDLKVECDFHKYLVTKGKSWEYEKERRLIFEKGVGHYEYPGRLTEITFGCKTTATDIITVFKIVEKMFDNDVLLTKASADSNSFQLATATVFPKFNSKIPSEWLQ